MFFALCYIYVTNVIFLTMCTNPFCRFTFRLFSCERHCPLYSWNLFFMTKKIDFLQFWCYNGQRVQKHNYKRGGVCNALF